MMLFWWTLPACPSARARGGWVPCSARTHAQRQEGASLTLLLFSESALSSWKGCGCTWAPRHMLGWGLRPFPWNLLLVRSRARRVGKHGCILCAAVRHAQHWEAAAFPHFWSFLSPVCIMQLSSSCSFSFPLSSLSV